MDISSITDITQLKAMAYDTLAARERLDNNLKMINHRISELIQNDVKEEDKKDDEHHDTHKAE